MHTVEAHASAKLIIAGEHAVVYLRPALAVPLPDIRVTVHITAGQPQTGCQLHMPDIQRSARLGVDSDHCSICSVICSMRGICSRPT